MDETNHCQGPNVLNKTWIHVFLIIGAICLVLALEAREEIDVAGMLGFTMDDSWIHMSIARNLVDGYGFSINKGEPLAVSTSPTWTLLEAAVFKIVPKPLVAGLLVSLICTIFAAWLLYLTAKKITDSPLVGLIAATLLIFNPISIWGLGSGMELPLVLLVVTLVFYCYFFSDADSATRKYITPLALAFAAVSRPELFVLIPLAILDTSWQLYCHEDRSKRKLIPVVFITQCIVILIALAPYFIFNFTTLHHPFPTTFYAKATLRGVGITGALSSGHFEVYLASLFTHIHHQFILLFALLSKLNIFFFLLFPVGMLMFTRAINDKSKSLGLFFPVSFLLLPAIMAIVAPPNAFANTMSRYYTLFIPFFALSGALGWHILSKEMKLKRTAMVILIVFIGYQVVYQLPQLIKKVAIDVKTNNILYVDLGKWVAKNIESDAYIATNDIGGVAYYAGQRRILDIMGLASPEIWPILRKRKGTKDTSAMKEFMKKKHIDYLITSPKYYPTLVRDTDTFKEIARFAVDYRIGHSWSPQIVYKCNWH